MVQGGPSRGTTDRRIARLFACLFVLAMLPAASGLSTGLLDTTPPGAHTFGQEVTGPTLPLAHPIALDDNGHRRIVFQCPSEAVLPVPATGNARAVIGCPIQVFDDQDPFGNLDIAVGPGDPRNVSIAATHGAPSLSGPSDRSRQMLPATNPSGHTVFFSKNGGLEWRDEVTDGFFPGGFRDNTPRPAGYYYAEEARTMQLVDATLVMGYVWNQNGDTKHNVTHDIWDGRFDQQFDDSAGGAVGVFRSPANIPAKKSAYLIDPNLFDARSDDGKLYSLSLIATQRPWLAATSNTTDNTPDSDSNETRTDKNGTNTDKNGTNTDGNATETTADHMGNPFIERGERGVAIWHETASAPGNDTNGLYGFIDAAWWNTGAPLMPMERLDPERLIGPCKSASDAVSYNGLVYVACVLGPGADHRRFAHEDDVDVWTLDPYSGDTKYIDTATIPAGRLRLATNNNGFMVLTSASTEAADRIHLDIAFGWYGRAWSHTNYDFGDQFVRLVGGTTVRSADVTALELSDSNTAFMIHKVWHDDAHLTAAPQTDEPEHMPNGAEGRVRDFTKSVFAFDPCTIPAAGAIFELGTTIANRNDARWADQSHGFNDTYDGLHMETLEDGRQRLWFAVDDYGSALFGMIDVGSASAYCPLPPPPVLSPALIPEPLATGSAATSAFGYAIGAVATAMVAALLLARKKTANALATKDE